MSRFTSISMSPGAGDVPQIDHGACGRFVDRVHCGDEVAFDHHRGPVVHYPGSHIEQASGADDRRQAGHGAGSITHSSIAAPESGTRGWLHTSTGNDTMIIEYSR